jgi:hypothetical protein
MADVAVITTKWVTVPDNDLQVPGGRRRARHVGPGEPVTLDKDSAERMLRLGAVRRPEVGEPGAPKRAAAKREDA